MVQIHQDFGRKFLSVGFVQESSLMVDGWVNRIGEFFQSAMKIVDDRWSFVTQFDEVFQSSKINH
jgi:hypothetical protein